MNEANPKSTPTYPQIEIRGNVQLTNYFKHINLGHPTEYWVSLSTGNCISTQTGLMKEENKMKHRITGYRESDNCGPATLG